MIHKSRKQYKAMQLCTPLRGFESTISFSVGGCHNHCNTPPSGRTNI
jgi:hypothetical protein